MSLKKEKTVNKATTQSNGSDTWHSRGWDQEGPAAIVHVQGQAGKRWQELSSETAAGV